MNLSDRRVRAAVAGDREPYPYFVFADGRLLGVGTGSMQAEAVAEVSNIREVVDGTGDGRLAGEELEIGLYVHGPWVCVTEHFGTNASLINTASGAVRELARADYHSDVSSYSIGFLDRDGRTLLVAQTQWNRLDIFDAETGANLTEREVFVRDSGRRDEQGRKEYDRRNYIDYFHSSVTTGTGRVRSSRIGRLCSPSTTMPTPWTLTKLPADRDRRLLRRLAGRRDRGSCSGPQPREYTAAWPLRQQVQDLPRTRRQAAFAEYSP